MLRDIRDALAGLFLLCIDRARGLSDPLQVYQLESRKKLHAYQAVSGVRDEEVAISKALSTAAIVEAYGLTDSDLHRVVRSGLEAQV